MSHLTQRTITVEHLTKRFGTVTAVDDLSFSAQPGRVTGFLGPNGAGKTTTLRILLGLVRATSGTAMLGGAAYVALDKPLRVVGASIDAAFQPGRTAAGHLRVIAPMAGVPDSRVPEVLALVGLTDAANRRIGGFSLGMKQRLALAETLLADPGILILDEPANGLDPEGIKWLRDMLRVLAAQGRTVLVSSHMLSEVEQTVDDVVVIAHGRLVHQSSLDGLRALTRPTTQVISPDAAGLAALAARNGWATEPAGQGIHVFDVSTAQIGAAAFASAIELHELAPVDTSLEQVFLRLTAAHEPDQPTSPPPNPAPATGDAPSAPIAPVAPGAPSATATPGEGN